MTTSQSAGAVSAGTAPVAEAASPGTIAGHRGDRASDQRGDDEAAYSPLTALMVGVVTVATVPDSDIMGILRSTGGELHPRPQPTSAA
jgi:hypothetical protein